LRANAAAAKNSEQPLLRRHHRQFLADRFEMGGGEGLPLFGETDQEGRVAEAIDPPRRELRARQAEFAQEHHRSGYTFSRRVPPFSTLG